MRHLMRNVAGPMSGPSLDTRSATRDRGAGIANSARMIRSAFRIGAPVIGNSEDFANELLSAMRYRLGGHEERH
jgi:hypothetical protein